MYTPAPPYEDVPKENVPRITEEEFQAISEAGKKMGEATNFYRKIHAEILEKYSKPIMFNSNGGPNECYYIQGHNVEHAVCVY
jgi:hypothetical protein